VIDSTRRPTPSLSVFAAVLLLVLGAGAARAQQTPPQDEATVGILARVLAATDARRYDEGALREAIASAIPGVRRQAVLAAGRIGDPAGVDLLTPLLADSDASVQAAAAFALGLLKDERSVPALQGLIRGGGQDAPQIEAVTALAKIGGKAGADALRQILESAPATGGTSATVSDALLESWRLGPLAPVQTITAFADDPDPTVRGHALYALGRLRNRLGLQPLLAALADRDSTVRAIAVRGVNRALIDSGGLDRHAIAERLRGLLNDASPRVQINALRALASFHDSLEAGAVSALLSSPFVNVAVQAETTLGATGGGAAVTALKGRLQNASFALRRQAVIALAEADSASGAAAALSLASDADWRWRSVAAEAYGAAHRRSALEGMLSDADGRVVAQALGALARIVADSDTTLAPRARQLLTHADPAVRSVAADILARHPDVDDVDRLTDAYRRAGGDPFDDARLSAVAALAAIANAGAAARLRVATRFVAVVPHADDYLVRRLAEAKFPDAAAAWGPVTPIATGRTDAEYRDVVRRYLLPAIDGQVFPPITIETDRGTLGVQLLPTEAPITVAMFLSLIDRRYFDGSRWHRVVPNFVVQDGDPLRGDGWGGPNFVLRDEVNPTRYGPGIMGMALSGPDTGGSQYFITDGPEPHLDGIYPVFGRVVAGASVLDAISQGDRIRSIHR